MIYFFILIFVVLAVWLIAKVYSREDKRPIDDNYDFMLANPPFGEDWNKFEP